MTYSIQSHRAIDREYPAVTLTAIAITVVQAYMYVSRIVTHYHSLIVEFTVTTCVIIQKTQQQNVSWT